MSAPSAARPLAVAALLLATMIWGFAFIAQKSAMDAMGPLTFIAARYLLGGLVVLPLALIEHRARADRPLTRRHWALMALLSANFVAASWLQQLGLITTTVTNAGFLTGLYVMFVPLVLLVGFRMRPHRMVLAAVPVALLGVFLLNGGGLDRFTAGDGLVTGSAVFWALHVVLLGVLAAGTGRPILVSAVSFLAAGAVSAPLALAFEAPSLSALGDGWIEIAYAGLLSTAIGFTLQAIGQQHVPPANAAIIMSGETLFAALGGAVMLGERLPAIGYLGAALIFSAILMVEALPLLRRRRPTP